MKPLSLPERLPEGSLLNDYYEITGFLGSGGFADVYAGVQRDTGMEIAIKVLRPYFGSDPIKRQRFEQRFVSEARLAARIRHPNVVTILACRPQMELHLPGQEVRLADRLYIVMERLHGWDLQDELTRNGPMAPSRALPLFISCLDGLSRGHDMGVVHKDLKPSNLFLTEPGARAEALKVLDYGIARAGEAEGEKLTQTGQGVFTPQYAAPEYLESLTATPALDVYQMGLILAEMLTGAPVVDAETIYSCMMIHSEGVKLPGHILATPLGPVLERATALKHTDRFPNAGAFAEALESIDPASVKLGGAGAQGGAGAAARAGTAMTMDAPGPETLDPHPSLTPSTPARPLDAATVDPAGHRAATTGPPSAPATVDPIERVVAPARAGGGLGDVTLDPGGPAPSGAAAPSPPEGGPVTSEVIVSIQGQPVEDSGRIEPATQRLEAVVPTMDAAPAPSPRATAQEPPPATRTPTVQEPAAGTGGAPSIKKILLGLGALMALGGVGLVVLAMVVVSLTGRNDPDDEMNDLCGSPESCYRKGQELELEQASGDALLRAARFYSAACARDHDKSCAALEAINNRIQAQQRTDSGLIPAGASPIQGDPGARVTIVEFANLECPYSAKVNPTLQQLLGKRSRDVRLVFKHLPMEHFSRSRPAARAAWAAGQQDRFWEYIELAMTRQKDLGDAALEDIAEELSLDMGRFKADRDSPQALVAVQTDEALAAAVGARGTPLFFINGIKVVGVQPLAELEKVIDAELKAIKKAKERSYRARVEANFQPPPPRAP